MSNISKSSVVTPVILCGGSGTRLWPLSRSSFPKQFLVLSGDGSPRKWMDSGRLNRFGWTPKVTLVDGINQAYQSFLRSQ